MGHLFSIAAIATLGINISSTLKSADESPIPTLDPAYRYMVEFGLQGDTASTTAHCVILRVIPIRPPQHQNQPNPSCCPCTPPSAASNLVGRTQLRPEMFHSESVAETLLRRLTRSFRGVTAIASEFEFTQQIPLRRNQSRFSPAACATRKRSSSSRWHGRAGWSVQLRDLALPATSPILHEALIADGKAEEALAKLNEALALIAECRDHCFESLALMALSKATQVARARQGDGRRASLSPRYPRCRRPGGQILGAPRGNPRLARLWHSLGKTTEAHDAPRPCIRLVHLRDSTPPI